MVHAQSLSRGRHGAARVGFTLIELLVVIAIITLLISILLPALGGAKCAAVNTKEVSAGRELQRAYNIYATDYKEMVLIGFLHYNWGHPGPQTMMEKDQFGNNVEGWTDKRYPVRIAPYMDYDYRGLINDPALQKEMLDRQYEAVYTGTYGPTIGDSSGGGRRIRGISMNPSFGLNSVFVGQDYEWGAFRRTEASTGKYFTTIPSNKSIQRITDIADPTKLMVFVTARGRIDSATADQRIVPGFFRVIAPSTPGPGGTGGSGVTATSWSAQAMASKVFDATLTPQSYGFVDLRTCEKKDKRAIVTMADGHVESLKLEQMKDMRRWCNFAKTANQAITAW